MALPYVPPSTRQPRTMARSTPSFPPASRRWIAIPGAVMPGYTTREVDVHVGNHNYRMRALSDRQQFADPGQLAARAGISSSLWCLFGQLWPSGRVLAEAMSTFEIADKRILELGCGLGLSSLVLQRRRADITASDHHPLAESFLQHNATRNLLPHVRYRDLRWEVPDDGLGRFDLIIGSDILYEQGHAALLAAMLVRHAQPAAEILITDPGRGNSAAFTRALVAQGYSVTEQRSRFDDDDHAPFRGRLLSYRRGPLQ
ncbi:MAG: methyltransferase type 12 [Xanthomonadaceae bacterium]|nr:methyltransferase type 12 [Xanthomonadaceae bacterium]